MAAEASTAKCTSSSRDERSAKRRRRRRVVPNNGKGRPQLWPLLLLFLLLLPCVASGGQQQSPSTNNKQQIGQQQRMAKDTHKAVAVKSGRLPFNVILILPERESNNDKFGLTVPKVRPVIDIAVEDVVKHGTMAPDWINITYHDSRYWEDTLLAERVSATGVVQAYCEKRLDAILGFADAYSLATVSKISAGFGEGVPVLTTTGLTSTIGSKKSYPYVTRMRGSYTQMADAAYKFVAMHDQDDGQPHRGINLNYQHLVFMYHDKRRALNKQPSGSRRGESAEEAPSSSCYFSLHAIKQRFVEHNPVVFMEAWKSQTPNVAFDEELARSKEEVHEWLKMASMQANGEFPQKKCPWGTISV